MNEAGCALALEFRFALAFVSTLNSIRLSPKLDVGSGACRWSFDVGFE